MITEINKTKEKTFDFPVLMIHEDDLDRPDPLIVKFYDDEIGIVICENEGTSQWRERFWDIGEFVPFHGSITLRNE